jgi:hypothetical protein
VSYGLPWLVSPRGNGRDALPAVPIRTGTLSKQPAHPRSASEFISAIEWSAMPRRMTHAFAIKNSKYDGGSLISQSLIGQINESSLCAP